MGSKRVAFLGLLVAVGFTEPMVGRGQSVNHAELLRQLGPENLANGERIYANLCANCHGKDGRTPSLPIARAFGTGPFKFGSDPYSMYRTLTDGNGLMGPQTWMTPQERYDVIHYIRESFMKPLYPDFQPLDEAYLSQLPSEEGKASDGEEAALDREYGGALASQLRVVGEDGATRDYPSVLTLRLNDGVSLAYDLHRLSQAALWRGGFLDLSQTQHQRPRGEFVPLLDGDLWSGLQQFGWMLYDGAAAGTDPLSPGGQLYRRGPFPKRWMEYHGLYVKEDQKVLHYSIRQREVWELPEVAPSGQGMQHTFRIAPGKEPLQLVVGQGTPSGNRYSGVIRWVALADASLRSLRPISRGGEARQHLAVSAGAALNVLDETGVADVPWVGATITGPTSGLSWEVDSEERLILSIAPSEEEMRFSLIRSSGRGSASFYAFASSTWVRVLRGESVPSIRSVMRGGPRRWPETLVTSIKRGETGSAYEKDEIGLPEPNPWNAWMRTSALAFMEDGRMVVATHGGDVWLVTLDETEARWKRFAAGLYEPFGIQVVANQIYLTCKDRLVRLHDLDGNDEADYYESFYADWDVSMFFHAFNFDLQRDADGYFYYAKSGQYTDFRLPGAVIRVSPDGQTSDVWATGFRTPNGMGILPDGRVTVGDNQGNWIPASKVSLIRPGGFYGYVNNLERKGRWAPDGGRLNLASVSVPETFEPPVIWMPQEVDSSCGGQVWVDDPRWGPLSGRMIHTSFGKARVFTLSIQEVDGVAQGALIRLPFQFQAGVQRARVNPADGQLYLVGLHGWNGGWPKELGEQAHGGLYRIRYTGAPVKMLSQAEVGARGLRVGTNFEIDRGRLAREQFRVTAWNYRWRQRYGSDQFSVLDPERQGRDTWPIESVTLGPDGRALEIALPDLQPCHQLLLELELPVVGGEWFRESVLFTVNAVPER